MRGSKQRVKYQISSSGRHDAAREIKQRAENPDTFKTGNAVLSALSNNFNVTLTKALPKGDNCCDLIIETESE